MKCKNFVVCGNEAKHGHKLCPACIKEAERMDEYWRIPTLDRDRGERIKLNNERQKAGR